MSPPWHRSAPLAIEAAVLAFSALAIAAIWAAALYVANAGVPQAAVATAVYSAATAGSLLVLAGCVVVVALLRRQRRAEEARREKERRLRSMLDAIPDHVWMKDRAGRYLALNRAEENALGLPAAEVIGRSAREFRDPALAAVVDAEDLRAMDSGMELRIERLSHAGPGQWREIIKTPLRAPDGAVEGMVGVSRDISGRIEAVRIERERAERTARARAEFLARMSHEIRTPMNSVVGMAELLLRQPLEARERHYASSIHRSARALLGILDDVLDFSRIEAGQLKVEPVTFALMHAVREIENLYGEAARAKGVRLYVSVAPELPAFVSGDPVRLRQVLLNLVSNAMKFTVTGEVVVSAAPAPGGRVRFEVRDTGTGIPASRHSTVFDPFAQREGGDPASDRGSGLGLAICRQIVRALGGEIGVESEPGKGARFWFEVALASAAPVARAADGPARRRFDGKRVLLVEDDPVNKEVSKTMLEHCGIAVVCAENGVDALSAFGQQPFDLVLMDCQMPVMNGLEATRRIRDREAARGEPRVPIVAVTAHAIAGYRQQCIDAGMDDYLAKPFEGAALEHLLECWLAGGPRAGTGLADATAPAASAGALDAAPIEVLRSLDPGGAEGLVPRVIGLFLETAPKNVEALHAQADADPDAAQRAAHSLKSSAARVGAMRVSALAAQAEARLRDRHPEGVEALVAGLQAAVREVAPDLRALARQSNTMIPS